MPLSHILICLFYYLATSLHHSFIPFIAMVLVFVFVPSSEIHPSVWARCSLHPLHRNDCNSGLDLVLVGGAGVLDGTRYGHDLLSLPDALKETCLCICFHKWRNKCFRWTPLSFKVLKSGNSRSLFKSRFYLFVWTVVEHQLCRVFHPPSAMIFTCTCLDWLNAGPSVFCQVAWVSV